MAVRDEFGLANEIIDKSEYPGNPKRSKNVTPVKTVGKITAKEPGTGKKLLTTFFQGDFRTVGSYLLSDILLPTVKDTLSDILHSTIDILVTGDSYGYSRSRRSKKDKDRVSYNKISKDRNRDDRDYGSPREQVKEIIFEEAVDADTVLDDLLNVIEDAGFVSVADYYEVCNIPSNFTDNKRGWESLASARVKRISGGYIISLPKPIRL